MAFDSETGSTEGAPLNIPRLHVITDDTVLRRPTFRADALALLTEGGERVALHLRGAGTAGRVFLEHAEHCATAAARSGGCLVVNDRIDIALSCGAWGVQLGRSSFSVIDARKVLPGGVAIGASVHDPEEAREAIREGADFLLAGTLYQSPSHPGIAGSGTGWLSALGISGPPVLGIGGITPASVAEVLRAGAHGVAVISGVWGAESPVAAVAEYLKQLG